MSRRPPRVRDTTAPRAWVWCSICKAYEHPKWHQPEWRRFQLDESNPHALAKYSKPPLTEDRKP